MGDGISTYEVSSNLYLFLYQFLNQQQTVSGAAVVYTIRVNMSVAAVKMKEELDWSESQKGYILVLQ